MTSDFLSKSIYLEQVLSRHPNKIKQSFVILRRVFYGEESLGHEHARKNCPHNNSSENYVKYIKAKARKKVKHHHMSREHNYYVYILSSESGTLYVGVTNDLERRVYEHKSMKFPGFTQRYKVNRLVYYEEHNDVSQAIEREKAIKGWTRRKKLELIKSQNYKWEDLAEDWG